MDPRMPQRDVPPGEPISSLINEYFDRRQAGEDITLEARYAQDLGFRGIAASPLTRSSHLAETLHAQATASGPKG